MNSGWFLIQLNLDWQAWRMIEISTDWDCMWNMNSKEPYNGFSHIKRKTNRKKSRRNGSKSNRTHNQVQPNWEQLFMAFNGIHCLFIRKIDGCGFEWKSDGCYRRWWQRVHGAKCAWWPPGGRTFSRVVLVSGCGVALGALIMVS